MAEKYLSKEIELLFLLSRVTPDLATLEKAQVLINNVDRDSFRNQQRLMN